MNGLSIAETIFAAVRRLEQLRDSSTPTDWRVVPIDDRADIRADKGYDYRGSAIATAADSSFGALSAADADLIVTLHATIDAQLRILYSAHGDSGGSHDEPGAYNDAVVLADSILRAATK